LIVHRRKLDSTQKKVNTRQKTINIDIHKTDSRYTEREIVDS